jgi:hypothetical protein
MTDTTDARPALRTATKPRLTPREIGHLCAVDRYIRAYNLRDRSSLSSAFSDVHDGGLYRHEVTQLISQRLLTWAGRGGDDSGLLGGEGRTVHLTDRALRIFWPHRIKGTRP